MASDGQQSLTSSKPLCHKSSALVGQNARACRHRWECSESLLTCCQNCPKQLLRQSTNINESKILREDTLGQLGCGMASFFDCGRQAAIDSQRLKLPGTARGLDYVVLVLFVGSGIQGKSKLDFGATENVTAGLPGSWTAGGR